jgi:serine protease Do
VDCQGFDEQVVRLDKELAELAERFVLVRVVKMRGVNLNVFDFDYDLTWMGFFLNADENVYGRFGGRDAKSADTYLTVSGLRHAMQAALAAYGRAPNAKPTKAPEPPRTPEQYSASQKLRGNACIHCHQVYQFQRAELKHAGKWRQEQTWDFLPPLPENLGLTLDQEYGSRIKTVSADSPAERAGVRPGDLLQSLNDHPVHSFADVQFVLHRQTPGKTLRASWQRGVQTMNGNIVLPEGWRKTDIAWRSFMWGLEPQASVYGKDLTAAEKKELGLNAAALAFRQGGFVPPTAKTAGIQANDIILGIDDKKLEMTMLQFNAHVRLSYKVGDRVTYNILRDGKRLEIPVTLPKAGED